FNLCNQGLICVIRDCCISQQSQHGAILNGVYFLRLIVIFTMFFVVLDFFVLIFVFSKYFWVKELSFV
ncbi:MAG: hypothetical protein KAJ14_00825, partial [Candidatus Omnitrophica bacterium]|nr:hypothetical protein [Candidatus Omnitrophota bacterium]